MPINYFNNNGDDDDDDDDDLILVLHKLTFMHMTKCASDVNMYKASKKLSKSLNDMIKNG